MRRLRALSAEPLKFAAVGMLNTLVDVTAFWLLITWGQTPVLIANTLAYSLGIINSYALNRLWTFRQIESQHHPVYQMPRFLAINLVGLGLSNLVVSIAVMFVSPLWGKLVATAATYVWNYAASKKWVYRSRPASVSETIAAGNAGVCGRNHRGGC